MPRLSNSKRRKISEQILHYLFIISPQPAFTSKIAEEIIRDEEFTKSLLEELEKNKLVTKLTKSSKGKQYTRRQRWRISQTAYEVYKKHQHNNP